MLLTYLILCTVVSVIASRLQKQWTIWFICSFLFTPVLAGLVLYLTWKASKIAEFRTIEDQQRLWDTRDQVRDHKKDYIFLEVEFEYAAGTLRGRNSSFYEYYKTSEDLCEWIDKVLCNPEIENHGSPKKVMSWKVLNINFDKSEFEASLKQELEEYKLSKRF